MNVFWEELTFGLPEFQQFLRIVIRLIAAAVLGGIIGFQREKVGKPAGLRTHILVALGTTVFILGCSGFGMSSDGLSRVIQGIVTGIGFIGAGAILKSDVEQTVKGLTTAASVWVTAAVGVTVGLGEVGLAIIATILSLLVLTLTGLIEFSFKKSDRKSDD